MLIWITGLQGSGKTTLANQIGMDLEKKRKAVVNLDGDFLRGILPTKMGYTIEERKSISKFYARLASEIETENIIVICSFVAMFAEARKIAKEQSDHYVEVFIDPPLKKLKEYVRMKYQSMLMKQSKCYWKLSLILRFLEE